MAATDDAKECQEQKLVNKPSNRGRQLITSRFYVALFHSPPASSRAAKLKVTAFLKGLPFGLRRFRDRMSDGDVVHFFH